MTDLYDLLSRLGATPNYTGFRYIACAVHLCLEQPHRLLLVTKLVYPDIGRRYGTNWKAVERNIRTLGDIIWRENRPLLEALAHRPLLRKPYPAQLLAILTFALRSPHCTDPLPVHGPAEPVAPPGEYHDTGVAGQAVNEDGCQALAVQDSVPLGELQVGGNQTDSLTSI